VVEDERSKFFFDLNGEIRFIHGKDTSWPHPNEFLKRTRGNDWVYYSSGEYYGGIFSALGEYYVPCMLYPSNNLWGEQDFLRGIIGEGMGRWRRLREEIYREIQRGVDLPGDLRTILGQISIQGEDYLKKRTTTLFTILGTRPSVLPPDTRDVDYECLPLIISEGCLYHCRFCRVKSPRPFRERSREEIETQIQGLIRYYDREIVNLNAIYLGEHDALAVSPDTIFFALERAMGLIEERSGLEERYIFLFASVDSLLKAPLEVFQFLGSLPDTYSYINVGLESFCSTTLSLIGKPLTAERVIEAFWKMQEINHNFLHVEITANFLFSLDFPETHLHLLTRFLGEEIKQPFYKGRIYLSPMSRKERRRQLSVFMHLKRISHLPLFLYIIQRF